MGSRLRTDVTHFFECFCEVVPPQGENDAWIIQQFPDKYKDEEVLKSVPKFAYPYKIENTVIQHYSFVLTNNESKWTFGFCRHDPNSQTAIVVLSYLPWHHAFYKFLDTTASLMHSTRAEDLREFLTSVYDAKLADPGKQFSVSFNKEQSIFSVDVPKPFQLPSIPENSNLTEYYNAVDSTNMMQIFASMLFERRIIIRSKRLKRLSACVQSANDLIYPMHWQHIFIPVLPLSLVEYLSAPMPFLVGVPEEVMKKVNRSEIGDVVILDADTNSIETPFDDLNSIPQEVVNPLKRQLKNKSSLLGDAVSRAFLRALVHLIGGYRDALRMQPGKSVSFDEEVFVGTRPASMKPFIKEMLNLQIFRQFIEERLTMLNNGLGFSDEFEVETFKFSEKSNSKLKQQYKEWTTAMKSEGKEFFKSVKDKANPAVKSAVKTVKGGGKGVKNAYKGLRFLLKEGEGAPHQLQNGSHDSGPKSNKPRSAPSSPTTSKRRIAGLSVPTATYRKDTSLPFRNSPFERSYSPLSPSSQPHSPGDSNSRSDSPDIPRIDLMNEVQDLLKLRLENPPVDRSLKPVRSLENFKHEFPNSSFPTSPEHQSGAALSSSRIAPPLFLPRLASQDSENLLLQSPDDVFSSPPAPPPRVTPPLPTQDLFGTSAFVVGGGRNENGDPLFYVAHQDSVDIVKLSPPVVCVSRRKQNEETEDLIRLDSTSDDMDDFDPLRSPQQTANSSFLHRNTCNVPLSISNPLYAYENHSVLRKNGNVPNVTTSSRDHDLLQEYGIDFNSFSSIQNKISEFETEAGSSKVNSKSGWTTFD
ncbi:DENN domain-containing protein 1B isoform X2 [Harmonia axyridis]|uniref:DENN domain-containing protein 1B isoform X2 n=1 Tax=Harmonia axyridis TaxID=115357 RepID=UPI001E277639|nr:DENN domain-containing protein 1B isoform X2 [Harmonia axyridis]